MECTKKTIIQLRLVAVLHPGDQILYHVQNELMARVDRVGRKLKVAKLWLELQWVKFWEVVQGLEGA